MGKKKRKVQYDSPTRLSAPAPVDGRRFFKLRNGATILFYFRDSPSSYKIVETAVVKNEDVGTNGLYIELNSSDPEFKFTIPGIVTGPTSEGIFLLTAIIDHSVKDKEGKTLYKINYQIEGYSNQSSNQLRRIIFGTFNRSGDKTDNGGYGGGNHVV